MSLPILSSSFFQEHQPDVGFFSKWQTLYTWNDRMFPIYEWQGVLYVGCSRPPESMPELSQKVVFVLCEPETLKKVWYEIQGTVVVDLKSLRSGLSSLPKANESSHEEAPEGLSLDLDIPTTQASEDDPLKFLNEVSEVSEETPAADPLAESLVEEEALEFPDFNPAIPLTDKTTVFSKEDFLKPLSPVAEEAVIEPVQLEEKTSAFEEVTQTGEITNLVAESDSDPEIGVSKLSPSLDATRLQMPTAKDRAQRATPVRSEVIRSSQMGEQTRSGIGELTGTFAGKMDGALQEIFKEMETHFSKVMILSKQSDQIKPWRWNSAMPNPAKAGVSYSLKHPSPFRIVSRTQMPYHGYIAPNEFNANFFAEWNHSEIPAHITVAPVIVNDQIVAMLLGISETPKENNDSLLLAEKVAGKIATHIKNKSQIFQAA